MPVVVTSCLLLTWIGGATLYRLPYKEVYARSKMPMSSHPGVGERTFANRCWPCHRSYSNWPKLAKKIKGGSLSFNMEGIVRSIERGKLDERGNPKIREQLVAFLLSQPQ